MNKKMLSISMFIIAGCFLFAGCGNNDVHTNSEESDTKPIAVKVSKVSKTTVESVTTLNGKVKPIKEVNIISKIPGKVEKIYYDIGQKVKKGSTLFMLEQKDIQLQINQAKCALDIAKASLNKAKGGLLEQQTAQLKSGYVTAQTSYNDAKLNYNRAKQLYEAGGVSKQSLEMAETQLKIAEEQYNSAKISYELTKTKINPESMATAEIQVKQAQTAYEIAKLQLDNTIVTSPVSGIIAVNNVKVGELIGSTSLAMSVVDLSSVTVEIGVTEDIINKIKLGDKVNARIKAATSQVLEGKIINVSPVADSRTQTYLVKIEIPNKDRLIKGGMFAEIKLNTDKLENVMVVPVASILNDNDKQVVYIVEADKAKRKEVKVGLANDSLVQVIKGLNENEMVVIKGQNYLNNNSKVIVMDK